MVSNATRSQPTGRIQILVLAAIVMVMAAGDFFLAAGSGSGGIGQALLVIGAMSSQWCLLAVLCGLAGRNAINGLLLSAALSSVAVIALLLGFAQNDAVWTNGSMTPRLWIPLALFPWLLPISALPLWLARLLFGWRFVDHRFSPARTIRLADLFALMVLVVYGLVLFRFVHVVVEEPYRHALGEMARATGIIAIALSVVALPSLWWLTRLQHRPRSSSQFLLSMAIFPAGLGVAAIMVDGPGFAASAAEFGILATPLVMFGSFYGGLWLLWRCGFRLQTRADRATATDEEEFAVAGWQRYAATWLLLLAVVIGVWGGRIDQKKRLAAAYPEFLKRVQAIEFRTGGKPSLAFLGDSVTDRDLRYLAGSTNLYFVNLRGNPISDRGLRYLPALSELAQLGLAETRVTDRGMAELAKIENLRALDLSDTEVTIDGLRQLKSPERFTTLGLARCHLGDPVCAVLRQFVKLHTLELGQTKITDTGLSEFADLSELVVLGLSSTAITDAGLSAVPGFSKLKSLDVNETGVNGVGFATWNSQQELMFLFADDSAFGDAGCDNVLQFPSLDMLNIRRTNVTDVGLASLAQHTSLKQIYLDETKITDDGLKQLFTNRHLLRISVVDTSVGDEAFRDWTPPPSILQLDLEGTRVTDDTCQYLARSTTLEGLVLARTSVTSVGLKQLASTPLAILDISQTAITASGLAAAGFESLSMVVISSGQFTAEEIDRLRTAGIDVSRR